MDEVEVEEELSEEIDEDLKYDNLIEELTDYCKLYHLPIFNHLNLQNILKNIL
jgi:hypothetical protein